MTGAPDVPPDGAAVGAGPAADHPFLAGIDTRLPAEAMRVVRFAAGSYLFHEGGPADALYLLRCGRVALDVHGPGAAAHRLDTIEAGDALGWSWLIPPHRWFFDARAVEDVDAVAVDAARLRAACDADPACGYAVMLRAAAVMYRRLQAARVRLLDLYGDPHAD
jgi:CRP/FNR family transcriptional regulator, cyclic AMP receptor protein